MNQVEQCCVAPAAGVVVQRHEGAVK